MNYPYPIDPYIQNTMAQAMQAMISGGPLPTNCFVVALPMHQAQQMFPQMMMNYAPGAGAMMVPQVQPYGQLYQPQIGPYPIGPPSNALAPYYPPGYGQNFNYPLVPYYGPQQGQKRLTKKNRRGKRNRNEPHSNVYNSSSFDTDMSNLSWSRLFGNHHHRRSKRTNSDQAALNYDGKGQQRGNSADSSTTSTSSSTSFTSSSTTSDETIRRVNVTTKPPAGPSSSSKQQTKGSLPFKYSSEFVPGTGKQQGPPPPASQKSTKKEVKLRSDDVFVVKKTAPSSSTTTSKQ